MNRLAIIIPVLLASVLLYPVSGMAAESGKTEVSDPALQKDECLLYLVECDTRVHSIQDKIEKLNEEIAKGTKVYTNEELRLLREKLKAANRTLDLLLEY